MGSTHGPLVFSVATRSPSPNVLEGDSLPEALRGTEVAFYLVHSMGSDDFEARDRVGAEHFAGAARSAGLRRIVYLGGLGSGQDLSAHLRSRPASPTGTPSGPSTPSSSGGC